MDLIIRNANLPDGRVGIDIGIKDGKIVALEVALTAKAQKEIDASGYLVSPPFVDAHFHMDATLELMLVVTGIISVAVLVLNYVYSRKHTLEA